MYYGKLPLTVWGFAELLKREVLRVLFVVLISFGILTSFADGATHGFIISVLLGLNMKITRLYT